MIRSVHTQWDQTYFIVEDGLRIVRPTGKQVSNGAYVVRFQGGEAMIVMTGSLVQAQEGSVIKVTTDQKVYKVGEPVVITATNVGEESAIVPACADDWFSVSQTDTGIEIRMKVPIICDGFFYLEPGESMSTDWDQTYLVWERNDPYYPIMVKPSGEQVPSGVYRAFIYGGVTTFHILKH